MALGKFLVKSPRSRLNVCASIAAGRTVNLAPGSIQLFLSRVPAVANILFLLVITDIYDVTILPNEWILPSTCSKRDKQCSINRRFVRV